MKDEPGVKDESQGAAPAPESQDLAPKDGAPASQPAAEVTPKGGDVTPAGERTYTQAEVNRIMHERTKDYAAMKSRLEAYGSLGEVEDLKKRLTPAQPPKAEEPVQLDEDDKKFVAYMDKLYPGLKDLGKGPSVSAEEYAFIQQLQKREAEGQAAFLKASEAEVFAFCDSRNIKDDAQRVIVRDMIASVILNDPAIAAKWAHRDPSVMKDAIDAYKKLAGSPTVAEDQAAAALKKKAQFLKPPLPAGAHPAPITQQKKLSDDERVDAAFAALSGGNSTQPEGA